ncbi:MAG: hypothetical protein HY735_00380 [Verrucomicrobia bacterium]|nr:hypothetical protein [Verrucomicrobiota bacterium]
MSVCSLMFVAATWGAVTIPPTRRAQNFVVQDLRAAARPTANLKAGGEQPIVTLDLDVLALSAERIKRALCRELDVSPRGWGRIFLLLKGTSEADQDIVIVSTSYADGWQYRVEIPDQVGELKFIRGMVEVLLLELANRGQRPKSAEIPTWLNEGLSLQLKNWVGPDLILSSVSVGSMVRTIRDLRGLDTLREARTMLRALPAVTLTELGHPDLANLKGDHLKRYQSSAQLFVHELSRLPNGRGCLVNLLRELPSCWNWETAFLRSFHAYFPRLLDLEKWWMVTLTGFTGRDPTQVWSPEICLEKLDEILLIPAQVRLAPDVLPIRTYVTPQQIISEWDFPLQRVALEHLTSRLAALRVNCPLDIASLVERYRQTVQNYLQKRAEAYSISATRGQIAVSIRLLVRETLEQLDELYRQREALRRDQAAAAGSSIKP